MTIALIGSGRSADQIAERLRAAGHSLIVFDPAHEPTGAVEEVLRSAGRLFLAFTRSQEAQDWLAQPAVVSLLAGRHLVDASRHAPQEARGIARQVTTAGARYLEIALLETSSSDRVIAAGREEDYHSEMSLLAALGQAEYLGPVGQVATVRLALAQISAAMTGALAMSLGLVAREGVDSDRFLALMAATPTHALQFDRQASRMRAGRYGAESGPSVDDVLLDLRAFTRAAVRHHLDTHQLVGLQHIVELAQELGYAEDDPTALHATL
ncbi:MAG: hypothetical protein ACP5DC_04505, partial [Halothiobacillaceae bacterium]